MNGVANSVGRLVTRGFVKICWQDGKTVAMLTSEGQESVFDLRKTWLLLRKQNSRISPLKSYELAS